MSKIRVRIEVEPSFPENPSRYNGVEMFTHIVEIEDKEVTAFILSLSTRFNELTLSRIQAKESP